MCSFWINKPSDSPYWPSPGNFRSESRCGWSVAGTRAGESPLKVPVRWVVLEACEEEVSSGLESINLSLQNHIPNSLELLKQHTQTCHFTALQWVFKVSIKTTTHLNYSHCWLAMKRRVPDVSFSPSHWTEETGVLLPYGSHWPTACDSE